MSNEERLPRGVQRPDDAVEVTRSLTIEWPLLPPPVLRGNGRGHWRRKAAQTAAVRESGMWSAVKVISYRTDLPLLFETADIHCTFYTTRPDACDGVNFQFGMKAFIDGLRDAQVIVDDQNWRVTELPPTFKKCKRGEERTEIVIAERHADH